MELIKGLDILTLFPVDEGSIDVVYGRIGTGKNLLTTIDIGRRLKRGEVVYCNYRIAVEDYDERKSFWCVLAYILGLKRQLKLVKCTQNLKYFRMDDEWAKAQGFEDFVSWLATRTDCTIVIDEGYYILDSYQGTKFSLRKRMAVLHTRHYNRTIVILTQRPTAVHVSARANVNRFFKCERPWPNLQKFLHILVFVKTEYQDMKDESVDEDQPIRSQWYFPGKRVLRSYNTKYLRGDVPSSQVPDIEIYRLGFFEQFWVLFRSMWKRRARLSAPARLAVDDKILSGLDK